MKPIEKPASVKRYRKSSVIVAAVLMVLTAMSLCALTFRIAFPTKTRAFMTAVFGAAPGFAASGQTPPPVSEVLPVAETQNPGNPV